MKLMKFLLSVLGMDRRQTSQGKIISANPFSVENVSFVSVKHY